MTQDAARAALAGFIRRSVDDGWRAALVITGKGFSGDGVLRRRVPDWLAEAPIREHVAGVSEAHRRHGGEGALYVALKRKDKPPIPRHPGEARPGTMPARRIAKHTKEEGHAQP